jgi:hypothetical protein
MEPAPTAPASASAKPAATTKTGAKKVAPKKKP